MKIVILGAGSLGSYLASVLSAEQHDVTVIDSCPKTLEKIGKSADIATRLGSGSDWQLLEEVGENSPELFVALSDDDEVNLVACCMAKNLGFQKTVARVRQNKYLDRSRLDFGRLFSVDHFIATELILAHDIFKCILSPGNLAVENFAHGAAQMRTLNISSKWRFLNQKISEIPLPDNLLIVLIKREGTPLIFPRGSDHIREGDEITVIGETGLMQSLHALFEVPKPDVKSVVLMGGTDVAVTVCKLLKEHKIASTIIEKSEEICLDIADKLPDTIILNRDGTDVDFLSREKIHLSHCFVACTHSNAANILAASLVKEAGCKEVIALISDMSYAPFLKQRGIYSSLSERISVSNRILSIAHADSVISVTSLYNGAAKIMEIKISSQSDIVGIPLADLSSHFPQDFLIALIESRGRLSIAKGHHILTPGDTVVVICSPKLASRLEGIF